MNPRCSDCRRRMSTYFVEDWDAKDAKVCPKCVVARRAQDGEGSWWIGWDIVRDVPNVTAMVMGAYCVAACIVALVLLAKM